MWSISQKELWHLLGSPIAYVAIGVYVVMNWLYLFVFPGSNIFEYKYATLATYFDMAPWIFMFLIAAIAMRSFSEEFRSGTMERLLTLPISIEEIVFGKFLACLLVSLICIALTIPFLITITNLSEGNGFDVGATLTGYLSLLMLSCVFNAIAIFASIIQRQMIVSFFLAILFCFILYFAFQSLSYLKIAEGSWDYYLQIWGIQSHYNNMRRGILDIRDVVYFISLTSLFIFSSIFYLRRFVQKKS